MEIYFFSILLKSFLDTGNSIGSQSRSLTNFLSAFLIISGCIFNGFKCLLDTKESIYCYCIVISILIKPFIAFFNSQGNLMFVFPDNEL